MTGRCNVVCGVVVVLVLAILAAPARAAVVASWLDPSTGILYERHDAGAGGSRTRDAYEALAQSIYPTVHLATIPNAATNAGIFANLVSGRGDAWIGFYQPNAGNPTWEPGSPGQNGDPLGGWRWFSDPTNSRGLTYTNWGGGEPNNAGGEHTAHMRGDGMWNDHTQTHTLDGIIEYPAGFQRPYPVAQLASQAIRHGDQVTIFGKAFKYDPNIPTVSAADRYRLEVRNPVWQSGGLLGQYYNCSASPTPDPAYFTSIAVMDAYLAGRPRVDQVLLGAINFPSTDGNPFAGIGVNVGTDNIAARWSGRINITTPGDYTFYTTSDDGSLLWIDGTLVVNNNYWQGMTERSGTINLGVGMHDLVIGWFEGGGGAGVIVTDWTPPGGVRQPIPLSALYYFSEWDLLWDTDQNPPATQVGDLLTMGSFGAFNLSNFPGDPFELRLTVWGFGSSEQILVNVETVPEPGSLALLGLGLAALARRRRK